MQSAVTKSLSCCLKLKLKEKYAENAVAPIRRIPRREETLGKTDQLDESTISNKNTTNSNDLGLDFKRVKIIFQRNSIPKQEAA